MKTNSFATARRRFKSGSHDKSPETITQLKELGFEVVLDLKSSKMIIGRVRIEKLAALAELKTVRYVAPVTNN